MTFRSYKELLVHGAHVAQYIFDAAEMKCECEHDDYYLLRTCCLCALEAWQGKVRESLGVDFPAFADGELEKALKEDVEINMAKLLQVGDVIQAGQSWKYGQGSSYLSYPILISDNAKSRNIVLDSKNRKVKSYDAYDPSRIKAKFVVEKTEMTGGGPAHGPNDIYPDGWQVTARRLRSDDSYDPKGELIRFYQTGCFNCMVKNPVVVGKKRLTFID